MTPSQRRTVVGALSALTMAILVAPFMAASAAVVWFELAPSPEVAKEALWLYIGSFVLWTASALVAAMFMHHLWPDRPHREREGPFMNWSWKTNLRRVAGAGALLAVGAAGGWFLSTELLLLVLAFLLGVAVARILFLRSAARRTLKAAEKALLDYCLYLAKEKEAADGEGAGLGGSDRVPGDESGAGEARSG